MTEPTNQPAAELLPCPFKCTPRDFGTYRLPDSPSRHIFCRTCNASGPWGDSDHEARLRWNTRIQPPAVPLDAREIDVVSQCRGNETGFHTCGLPIGGCGATALTTTPATSEAQTAQSDPTVTVSASGVDPSLPTHCDHGVSLDDPCETCRTAHPSPTTGAIEAATNEIMEHFHSIDIDALPNRKTITAIISKHLPPEAPSISEAIAVVQDYRKWYDESLFTPTTMEETQAVHRQFDGMVDRISAQAARHVIDKLLEQLRALPPDARAVDGDVMKEK